MTTTSKLLLLSATVLGIAVLTAPAPASAASYRCVKVDPRCFSDVCETRCGLHDDGVDPKTATVKRNPSSLRYRYLGYTGRYSRYRSR